ncbi:MAG: diguanylate cyclase [Comamonadaceae bacterium]|nr:MAG: diguanylate cyclase [Comamonadaceae bacterium]
MGLSVSPLFLSGAFAGIAALILLLSLLIGHAYRERMLWWHGATIAAGLGAQLCDMTDVSMLCAPFRVLQVALATQTLRYMLGADGAVRGASRASTWLLAVLGLVLVVQFAWPPLYLLMFIPWAVVTVFYMKRAWAQGQPWISWLGVGQLAWGLQWLVWLYAAISGNDSFRAEVTGLAALALAACSIYLSMVWRSRLQSENSLRVQAREKVDPLTGFVMPRLFFTQVNDAQVRSMNLGYPSVLLLVRLQNLDQIIRERESETSEPVVLAAAQAIASALRPQDIGARVSGNRFGVLAEGVATGQGAIELATRIVAHGLRGDDYGLQGSEMRFQIAGLSITNLASDVSVLLKGLEEVLSEMAAQSSGPPIRILSSIELSHALNGNTAK